MGQVTRALPEMGTARGGLLVVGVLGCMEPSPGGVCPSPSLCREAGSQLIPGEVNPTPRTGRKCVCCVLDGPELLSGLSRVPALLNLTVSTFFPGVRCLGQGTGLCFLLRGGKLQLWERHTEYLY